MVNHMPEGFPPLTLAAQRALSAISLKYPEKLIPTLEAFYGTFWVEGNSKVSQPEGFVPVLENVLGKNATQEVLQAVCGSVSLKTTLYVKLLLTSRQANQPEAKSLLTSNTDRAFKGGAFGLPWFECTNSSGETEGFWGIDHLGQVANFLGLDRSADAGFRALL